MKLVIHTDSDKYFAIKIMKKSVLSSVKKDGIGGKTAFDDVLQEIAIMKRLDHENIVRLYEVINDPASNKLYLIVEYLERGPVYKIQDNAERMPIDDVRRHLGSICHGLDYLHQLGIIHRDIKPENILVDSAGVCRLTDFGVSHQSAGDGDLECPDSPSGGESPRGESPGELRLYDSQGTPAFLTPEQARAESVPGRMADIWALGVTIFAMSTAKLPFQGKTWREMSAAIKEASPCWDQFPDPTLEDLLRGVLRLELEQRTGNSKGVIEVLAHPFLGGDESAVLSPRRYSAINVTEAERAAAVKTGHNITLRLSGAVGAMMKVDQFRRKSMQPIVKSRGTASGSANGTPNAPPFQSGSAPPGGAGAAPALAAGSGQMQPATL